MQSMYNTHIFAIEYQQTGPASVTHIALVPLCAAPQA